MHIRCCRKQISGLKLRQYWRPRAALRHCTTVSWISRDTPQGRKVAICQICKFHIYVMHDHHCHLNYRDFQLSSSTKMDLAEGRKGCGVRKIAVSPKCQSSMSMGGRRAICRLHLLGITIRLYLMLCRYVRLLARESTLTF